MSFALHGAVMVTSEISTCGTYLSTQKVAGNTFFAAQKVNRKLNRILLGGALKRGQGRQAAGAHDDHRPNQEGALRGDQGTARW